MLLEYLNLKKVDEIDKEAVFELRATANAIKEGTTTVQDTFIKPAEEKRQTELAKRKIEEAKEKAASVAAKVSSVANKATSESTKASE